MSGATRSTAVSAVSRTGVPPVFGRGDHGRDGRATHGRDARATVGRDVRPHVDELDAVGRQRRPGQVEEPSRRPRLTCGDGNRLVGRDASQQRILAGRKLAQVVDGDDLAPARLQVRQHLGLTPGIEDGGQRAAAVENHKFTTSLEPIEATTGARRRYLPLTLRQTRSPASLRQ